MRFAVVLGVVALLTPGHVLAQEPETAPEPTPAEALEVSDGSGVPTEALPAAQVVDATVTVQRMNEDMIPEPVVGASVRVHVVDPPMDLVETREGVTDASGHALFRIPVRPLAELTAEVQGEARLFSEPIPLDTAGPVTIPLTIVGETSDPSQVFISRMITVLQPNEEFITVQQVFNFGTDGGAVYRGDTDRVETLIRIVLPEGAKGIRVMQPGPERAREVDGLIYLAAEAYPAGTAPDRRPGMIVQYSLKNHNRSAYTFDQRMTLPVRNASFVVPQGSDYARHRAMPIAVDAPLCDDGRVPDQMCFAEINGDTEGMPLNPGVEVLVARGGTAEPGDHMVVRTDGWPSVFPLRQTVAVLSVVLSLLLAFWLLWKTRLSTGQALRSEMELKARLEALRSQARDLKEQWDLGDLLRGDYERRRQWLAEQMATTLRRLRESGVVSEPAAGDAPAESEATTDDEDEEGAR
jgi:hypothetical protein